jgi:hypothetical protein
MKRWLLIIILLLVLSLLTACSTTNSSRVSQPEVRQDVSAPANAAQAAPAEPAQPAAPTFATQSNNEKAVAVDITPLNLDTGETTLEFEVAFNTHSVDLSFDPAAISILRDSTGREYPAVAWEGSGSGGHHRSGVLRFQMPEATSDSVELVIQGVAGVPERVFHWDLTQ